MNNEILIQRWVDGDLSKLERQQALQTMRKCDQWQGLALAFVEKQILDEAIGGIRRESSSCRVGNVSVRRDLALSTGNAAGRSLRLWSGIARVAAGVLLLVFGYALGAGTPASSRIGSARLASEAHESDHRSILNETSTMATPLDLSEALARSTTPIPSRFRLDLLQAGYVLSEDEQLTKVSLPFGGTMQMPVRKVDIRYLGASAFQ